MKEQYSLLITTKSNIVGSNQWLEIGNFFGMDIKGAFDG
jgi:hypothetical protein